MNDIPSEIKDLISEACSLEYCPVDFRVWAAGILSEGTAASMVRLPDTRWVSFRTNLYWALLFSYPDEPGWIRHMVAARDILDAIKREHDNSRDQRPD